MCANVSVAIHRKNDLTHLALVHVSGTLVVVGEGNEICHHAQHAVRKQLLMCGDCFLDLVLKDSHVEVYLKKVLICQQQDD